MTAESVKFCIFPFFLILLMVPIQPPPLSANHSDYCADTCDKNIFWYIETTKLCVWISEQTPSLSFETCRELTVSRSPLMSVRMARFHTGCWAAWLIGCISCGTVVNWGNLNRLVAHHRKIKHTLSRGIENIGARMYIDALKEIAVIPTLSSLAASEIVVESLGCRQWRQSSHHGNFWFSV